MRIRGLAEELASAIETLEPIWQDARFLCNLESGANFPDCSFKEAMALDFLNAVADVSEAVGDVSLTGKAQKAARLAFILLEQAAPETLFPPAETVYTPSTQGADRRALEASFFAGCKELRRTNSTFEFWEPISQVGLEDYDTLQSTSYRLLPAKIFLAYFLELKSAPDLSRLPLIDSFIERLHEYISTQDTSPMCSNALDGLPSEPLQRGTPSPKSAEPSALSSTAFPRRFETPAWRYVKVVLRTVWRVCKIVAVSVFCLLIAAVIVLQVFMFLYEHWNNESKRGRGTGSGGLQTEKFFAFLNSVTWLPQQMWQGLVLIVTILFLALVFAGKWVGEQALANMTVVVILASIVAVTLLVWVFIKERKAEFEPSSTGPQPTTISWVMGMIVLVAAVGVSFWWIQDGRATFVQGYVLNRAQVTTEGANVEPPQPKPQSSFESTPSVAAVLSKVSRCDAEAEEQSVPLWNGYSLRLSPTKSQSKSGCDAAVIGANGRTAWSSSSTIFQMLPVTGQDINGDGMPELVLEANSGEQRCCLSYYILTLSATPKLIELPDNSVAKFERTQQGGYVIHMWDWGFQFFDGLCRACSVIPELFLRLDGSVFRDVSSDHWATYQHTIDTERKSLTPESIEKFRQSDGHQFELMTTKSAILGIVLEYLYGGRPQQAWKEFESMWPETDQSRMRQLIEDTRAKGILGKTHAVRTELRSGKSLTRRPTSAANVLPPFLPSSLVAMPAEVRSSITREPRSRMVLSGNVTERLQIRMPQPSYRPQAKQARISGFTLAAGRRSSNKDDALPPMARSKASRINKVVHKVPFRYPKFIGILA
jgi:hypothetical protein